MKTDENLVSVKNYYSDTFSKHGASARGVDWKDEESQLLRFSVQYNLLLNTLGQSPVEITDFGCSYGAFLSFLRTAGYLGKYTGIDFVQGAIEQAKILYKNDSNNSKFVVGKSVENYSQTIFASGVFNIMGTERANWIESFVRPTLHHLLSKTDYLIVNFLNGNPTRPASNLLYLNQEEFIGLLPEWVKAPNITEGYGLWEWTALIENKRGQF